MAVKLTRSQFDAQKYARMLANPRTLEPFEAYTTVKKFLFEAFDAYSHESQPIPDAERSDARESFLESLPAIDVGLRRICGGLNPDKRVEAQCCLSGLQFIVDDLNRDSGVKRDALQAVLTSDVVEDIKDFLRNSVGSPAHGHTDAPDLTRVPETHDWWKDDYGA